MWEASTFPTVWQAPFPEYLPKRQKNRTVGRLDCRAHRHGWLGTCFWTIIFRVCRSPSTVSW
jgi:hypothetical protein